jgi:hypothetical protein
LVGAAAEHADPECGKCPAGARGFDPEGAVKRPKAAGAGQRERRRHHQGYSKPFLVDQFGGWTTMSAAVITAITAAVPSGTMSPSARRSLPPPKMPKSFGRPARRIAVPP